MSTRGSLSPIPDEDPVQALLRDIQQNGVTGPLDIDTGANTEADTGTSTEPACPVDEGSELPANITEGSRRRPRSETSSNIHDVVEHLKRRKMFTDQSRADLDLFEQVHVSLACLNRNSKCSATESGRYKRSSPLWTIACCPR